MHLCSTLLYIKINAFVFRFSCKVATWRRGAAVPSWWAWKACGVPVLFLGIHCNRAADHPRSSDVSRPISRPLCPHTKRSKTLRNVTPGGKLCEILHFAPKCVDLQTVIVSDARRGRSHIPPPIGRGGREAAPSVAAVASWHFDLVHIDYMDNFHINLVDNNS